MTTPSDRSSTATSEVSSTNNSYNNNNDCTSCTAEAVLGPDAQPDVERLAQQLAGVYPLTVAAFQQMEGGLTHLGYIVALQERWQRLAQGQSPTTTNVLNYVPASQLPTADAQFDLVYCGGVLGLFSAAVMAKQGYRVAVFDQRRVGTSHREWNISDAELEQFVEAGLFSRAELQAAVAGRYATGLVKFYADGIPEPPAELHLKGVLDVAIDLSKLLTMARARFEEAGGTILDYHALEKVFISEDGPMQAPVQAPVQAVVEIRDGTGTIKRLGARLVVNGLGAISPLSLELQQNHPFDGVCPTVGTTARGFKLGQGAAEVDPTLGDVLLSVAHAQSGRQLIWEGFPGHDNEMTVYLFYYDLVEAKRAAGQNLLDLFETYFQLLPTYKTLEPDFTHLRPVYGYIPARHHRAKWGSASQRGIISVGDATSPQSALTFCGFGSQVRNLPRLTRLLAFALDHDLLEEKHLRQIGAHQSNISVAWVFSRFMQPVKPLTRPNDVNRMLNVFCAALNELGPDLTNRFFQDRFSLADYNRLILTTAWRAPRVFPFTLEVLGFRGIGQWIYDYVKFCRESLFRAIYRRLPAKVEDWLKRLSPAMALRLAARREEWLASGLLTAKR